MPLRHAARLLSALLLGSFLYSIAAAQDHDKNELQQFDDAVEGLTLREGFIDLYLDADHGKMLALLPPASEDGTLLRFIHAARLRDGLGSNPLGLDRGWGNFGRIIRFRQIGARVIAEVENHRYRAETKNDLERKAVASSFANSFIWATEPVARRDDGRVLIDLSGFLVTDHLGLAKRLAENGSSFALVADRTMTDVDSLLNFPDNVEIDAWMTFTSDDPGREVSATSAEPGAVTLVQHHSFVRLPDDGYRVRHADPRTGTFTLGFYDFATPLDEPLLRGYVMRHRLQFNEPGNPASGVREPIVFYIDPGAPEAIREALLDGATWWADAFAAAGFEDGYRVELLPEDAHPQDVRYNVVQWVHRQTRGWSYGGAIIDPRSGEMIKGHVILGSQRVRQDRMIFEGLAGVEHSGSGRADDPVQIALNRIRQLAAHEIGHALGFGHNFAASSNDRASVMDYPAPWVHLDDGQLDFSRAYDRGIGAWDKLVSEWLYREFAPGTDENNALDAIVERASTEQLRFIADQHGRSVSTAHPYASVWDNGDDPVAELQRALDVRAHALARFGADRIAVGQPLAELRQVLVPIYLYHRYQVDAAAKLVAGIEFEYAQRGASATPTRTVNAERQRAALAALLKTLEPSTLDLRDELVALLPPRQNGFRFDAGGEELPARTEPLFDRLSAVEAAADITLNALLNPTRAERLAQQSLSRPGLPSLGEVLTLVRERLTDQYRQAGSAGHAAIAQRVMQRLAAALMALDGETTSLQVRAASRTALNEMAQALEQHPRQWDRATHPVNKLLARQISNHLERQAPAREAEPTAPTIPPGSPIGSPIGGSASSQTSAGGLQLWLSENCWHCAEDQ